MVFNSLEYLLFFPIILFGFFLLPHRFRWAWLLAASAFFYMLATPAYIFFLMGLMAVDYVMGAWIASAEESRRRWILTLALILNFLPLFIFKYFDFAISGFTTFRLHWILPLGLSFHTFQSAAYLIDIYRKQFTPERHAGYLALYILYFPQLVAGPIERPNELLPQLHTPQTFDRERLLRGLQLIGWGLFKKIVVADRLGLFVDQLYAHPGNYDGVQTIVGLLFFAVQLYADFSGYVDIARGSSLALGLTLASNFDRPYIARSIAEFWRRWHITLSQWFRDYIYFPLARVRGTRNWLLFTVVVTFLLTGVWHGAGWTFVIMGLIHGGSIAIGLATKNWRAAVVRFIHLDHVPRVHAVLQGIVTFTIVTFSWVFFRAVDLKQAGSVLSRLVTGWPERLASFVQGVDVMRVFSFGYEPTALTLGLLGIAAIAYVEYIRPSKDTFEALLRSPLFVRTFVYAFIILLIVVFGEYRSKEFIYFQF